MARSDDIPANPLARQLWLHRREEFIAAATRRALVEIVERAGREWAASVEAMTASAAGDFGALAQIPSRWESWTTSWLLPRLRGVFAAGSSLALVIAPTLPDGYAEGWDARMAGAASEYTTTARNRLVGVGTNVWIGVRDRVARAVEQGLSIPELSTEIQSLARFGAQRADLIARTETISALAYGEAGGMASLGALGPTMKSWVATRDSRTRKSHAAADDQVVPMNGKFRVGSTEMEHPGDRSAPPGEVCNCRCTVAYYFPGDRLPNGETAPENVSAAPAPIVMPASN